MRALLLPVKDLNNAKKRLMGVLTPEERFGLAEAMLKDTFRAVRDVKRAEKIFVVTNYKPAMSLAEESGWEILQEEHQISESDSVDAASRESLDRKSTRLNSSHLVISYAVFCLKKKIATGLTSLLPIMASSQDSVAVI